MKRLFRVLRPSIPVFALLAFALRASPAGLTILPTFDSSITNDPNAAAIEASINQAIAIIEGSLTDAISVPITFQEMQSGLGSSTTPIFQLSYSSYRALLAADAKTADDVTALATLPIQVNSPVDGQASMWVTAANGQALGLNTQQSVDGIIGLNTALMSFDSANVPGNEYQALGVILHEIDEVLGLGSGLDLPTNFPRLSRPQDLFRYSASGVRSFTTSGAATSYLSIDAGATDLVNFNQLGGGSDYGDWASSATVRVQDAFDTPGAKPIYGVELRNLDVIGYDAASSAPEPGTLLLMSAAAGLLLIRKRRA
jgi:hypothetical protein